jgi:head-tail adaptor
MSDRINQSPIASPSYTTDFSLQERLQDLLSYAEVTGRLTEDEVDLVAHSVTDEARSRHVVEQQWEDYWQWRADVARRHQEESRRAERERAAREDQMVAGWRADSDAERRGRLMNRVQDTELGLEAEAC